MNGDADTIVTGGQVYVADVARTTTEALAIKDGRVVAAGRRRELQALRSPRTEVIDAHGALVCPAFQDSHIHAAAGGFTRMECDLSEGRSREEYYELIRDYSARHTQDAWVTGSGWHVAFFPDGIPTRQELDGVVGDRPAYFVNRDHHGAWVSSKALELAGISRQTSDPVDGRIERDPNGEPVGMLQERAMSLVSCLLPPRTLEQQMKAILAAQAHLHSLGIASWQDAIVGEGAGVEDTFDAYRTLSERNELLSNVVGALWFDGEGGADQLETLIERRHLADTGRFRATSAKLMLDGVCENFTAAMLEPYLGKNGKATANYGLSFFDDDDVRHYAKILAHEGFQLHFHAIGDRAVRCALDAIEAAEIKNPHPDLRHHVAHVEVVHPDDVCRFGQLGVAASAQPLWAQLGPQLAVMTMPFLGPERAAWVYPFGSLLREGAVLAFGSDWPVSPPDPFAAIHVAVNRTTPPGYPYGEALEPLLPNERLTLGEAIAAYTMGSAFINHLDDVTGSLEPGKDADFILVDPNPLDVPLSVVGNCRVTATFLRGSCVYDATG
jgi:predicted amidohydrolase YtcJ